MLSDGDLSFGNLSSLSFLFNINSLLSGEDLDMGLGRKIGTNTTMGSIGTSSSFSSSIDLNVINSEVLEVLDVGIGFEVIDQSKYNLD